jgi:hypothetical protein
MTKGVMNQMIARKKPVIQTRTKRPPKISMDRVPFSKDCGGVKAEIQGT